MTEQYNKWNEVKKETSKEKIIFGFKTRDIFNVKVVKILDLNKMEKEKSLSDLLLCIKNLQKICL